jgi:hypothetical protein
MDAESRSYSNVRSRLHPNHLGTSNILKWGHAVCEVLTSEGDVRTVRAWAALVNMSVSSLRELCSVVGVQAKNALDFSRVLRVVMKSPTRWRPEFYLDVSDRRTLRRLTHRSGLERPLHCSHEGLLSVFFANQRFIETEVLLPTIRQLLSSSIYVQRLPPGVAVGGEPLNSGS